MSSAADSNELDIWGLDPLNDDVVKTCTTTVGKKTGKDIISDEDSCHFVETFNQTIEEPEDEEDQQQNQNTSEDNNVDPFLCALARNKDIIDAELNLMGDEPEPELSEKRGSIEMISSSGNREKRKPKRQETLSGNNPFRKGSIGDGLSDTEMTDGTEDITRRCSETKITADEDENPFMAVLKSMGVADLDPDDQRAEGFDPLTTIYPDSGDEKIKDEEEEEEDEVDPVEEDRLGSNLSDFLQDGATSRSSDSEDEDKFGVFQIKTPVHGVLQQKEIIAVSGSQLLPGPRHAGGTRSPRQRKVQQEGKPWLENAGSNKPEEEEVDRMFAQLREGEDQQLTQPDEEKVIVFESPLSSAFGSEQVEWEALPSQSTAGGRAQADTDDVWGEEAAAKLFDADFEPLPGEVVTFEPYYPKIENFEWKMLIRQPEKKSKAKQISRYTTNRWWKEVYVRLGEDKDRPCLRLYDNLEDDQPYRTVRLEPYMQLSRDKMQQYDKYGKLHIFKVNHVVYKEMVGMRTEKFSLKTLQNLVSHKPRMNMMLDHMPVRTEVIKFGSLDQRPLRSLMVAITDAMMSIKSHRDASLEYTKEEVCCYVNDEYECELNETGSILAQKARTRIFCAAFVTGGRPYIVLGINDKWRYGNEVVSRKDIIPIMHDDWINIYEPEFHSCINMDEYEKDHMIKFYPLDGCKFELLRFRTPLRENKELPVIVSSKVRIHGVRVEMRVDLSVPGFFSASKRHGAVHCDDLEIRVPVPEEWAYHFRVEKHTRYGSVHSALRKPGKIKGLERITQLAHSLLPPSLLEASAGIAKYEHLYRAIVWRVPRLPDKHEASYKPHMMTCKMVLAPQDTVPSLSELAANFEVEFTMSASTVSGCTVRSISVEHTITPERFVKYLASFKYSRAIEYEYGQPKPPLIKSILDDDDNNTKEAANDSERRLDAVDKQLTADSSSEEGQEADAEDAVEDSVDLFSNDFSSNVGSGSAQPHSALDDLMSLDFNQNSTTGNATTGGIISGNIMDDIAMVDD